MWWLFFWAKQYAAGVCYAFILLYFVGWFFFVVTVIAQWAALKICCAGWKVWVRDAFSLLFYHLFRLKFVAYFVAKTDIGWAFDCVMSCQKINVQKKTLSFFSQTVTLPPCVAHELDMCERERERERTFLRSFYMDARIICCLAWMFFVCMSLLLFCCCCSYLLP